MLSDTIDFPLTCLVITAILAINLSFFAWLLKATRILRTDEAHASLGSMLQKFATELSSIEKGFNQSLQGVEGRIIELRQIANDIEQKLNSDQIEHLIEKRAKSLATERIETAQKLQREAEARLSQALGLIRGLAMGPGELSKIVASGIPKFLPADISGMILSFCGQRNIRVPTA